jgi:hypothetical protein
MTKDNSNTGCVLCCHIAGVFDVNRRAISPQDDFSMLEPWLNSVVAQGVKAIIFHNHFTAATCTRYAHPLLVFERVVYNETYSPNVFRYFAYRDYLQKQEQFSASVFMTDATDVVMQRNPFTDPLFIENPPKLFCGDEPKPLDNEWMRDHGTHFREQSKAYALFEATFAKQTLLNCGIIGGRKELIGPFLDALCNFHEQYNQHNPTAYTGDMGAFNFIARSFFGEALVHGAPVNTVFKLYEEGRKDCWFRHK